jgi:ribosomal protein S18 acetylase RimI-like enzyme
MDVRTMTIDDYDEVYALWLGTPGMGLNDVDDSREGIAKYLGRNPGTCFVAEREGRIVGVILSGHDGRRGYIQHTAVAADQQRQGIGSALVETALAALKHEGISKVGLFVFKSNVGGNAFWEAMGFGTRDDLNYRDQSLVELTRIDT